MDDNPYRSPHQTAASPDARNAGLFAFLSRFVVVLFRLSQFAVGSLSMLIGLCFSVAGCYGAPGLGGKGIAIVFGGFLCLVGYGLNTHVLRLVGWYDSEPEISQDLPNNRPPHAL